MSTIRRRRAEFSAILVLAASAAAWGQPPGGGQAESGKKKPAVPPNVVIERDVRYGEADDHALLLDIVRPTEPSEQPRPVIAFIHGGAWSGGNKEIVAGPLVPFAASGDYFCVSIEYRLSGVATWPAQIHDCKAAIRWLRANARTYNIDPEKIGVWGNSAGGHLVSMLGVSADVPELEGGSGTPGVSSRVACVVDYCGPSDFMALARVKESKQQAAYGPASRLLGGPIEANPDAARSASPVRYASKRAAPTLIVHGTDDTTVPPEQADLLYAALKQAGADVTFIKIQGGTHSVPPSGGPELLQRVRAFFARHLRGQDVPVSDEPIPAQPRASARAEERNGMVLVPVRRLLVGTSDAERKELARQFDCHPTWLNDDLPQHEAVVPAFWIDRFPVTNAQYLAFVEATRRARPSWWNRWGGAFPSEYADHPAVGLSSQDAALYATWAGKRLPRAEEWEAAVAGPEHKMFAWGDEWPGPLKPVRPAQVSWELPGTRPVGTGDCGRAGGVEDFAGQVLEWVSDSVRAPSGSQFHLLKGASWFHEDPLSYRVAAGWYANETWQSAFSGVRCALDASAAPPAVARAQPNGSISLEAARSQLERSSPPGPIALVVPPGQGRGLSIRVPKCGEGTAHLMAPETVLWNRTNALTFRDKPDLTWTERTAQRAAYELRLPQGKGRVQAEFLVLDDRVEQRFTATNLTAEPAEFATSSCFRLQGLPMFYDCEQLRTYALSAGGEFVPARRLARGGARVRWITRLTGDALGQDPHSAVLAVVSRDQRQVIVAGRAGPATGFTLATNTLFTCLHADSSIPLAAGQQATTREVFWFLEGTLDTLRDRISREFATTK